MKYIAIDTSNNNLTVIVKGESEAEFFDPVCKTNHSVALMVELEKCLEKSNTTLKDIDFVACVVGAGSFTGIRIGVASAKALAFANNKKVLPITSFDTIAYNNLVGKTLAVIDAGHGGYYVCGYDNTKVILPPEYIDFGRLQLLSKDFVLLSNEQIENIDCKKVDVLNGLKKAIELKESEVTDNIECLEPLYIRKSQAEEGR